MAQSVGISVVSRTALFGGCMRIVQFRIAANDADQVDPSNNQAQGDLDLLTAPLRSMVYAALDELRNMPGGLDETNTMKQTFSIQAQLDWVAFGTVPYTMAGAGGDIHALVRKLVNDILDNFHRTLESDPEFMLDMAEWTLVNIVRPDLAGCTTNPVPLWAQPHVLPCTVNDNLCVPRCIAWGLCRTEAAQSLLELLGSPSNLSRPAKFSPTTYGKRKAVGTHTARGEQVTDILRGLLELQNDTTQWGTDRIVKVVNKLNQLAEENEIPFNVCVHILDCGKTKREVWRQPAQQFWDRDTCHIYLGKTMDHVDLVIYPAHVLTTLQGRSRNSHRSSRLCDVCGEATFADNLHICTGSIDIGICNTGPNDDRAIRSCGKCGSMGCGGAVSTAAYMTCPNCNGRFNDSQCLSNHKKNRQCYNWFYCYSDKCRGKRLQKFDGWEEHNCNHERCFACLQMVDLPSHKCFLKRSTAQVPYAKCTVPDCHEVGTHLHKKFVRASQPVRRRKEGEALYEQAMCVSHTPEGWVPLVDPTYLFYDLETMQVH